MFKEVINEVKELDNAIKKETFKKEYTQEEILEAITLIKTVCRQHACQTCPFRKHEGGCEITNCQPSLWKIFTEPREWRAFY